MSSMVQEEGQRFEFGNNWHHFIQKNFGPERVRISRKHLLDFIEREDLKGLTFLDIGCGSGLHSVAALEAGAVSVRGFDYDANSVATSRYVHAQVGNPSNWTVEQGSVLDDTFVKNLGAYDLVYSWGVLHHTGDVWHAIRNAAACVRPGGMLYIALYSADVQVNPTPEFWLDVKQKYVAAGWLKRRYMDLWYVWRFQLRYNPLRLPLFLWRMHEYKKSRGMNLFTDIRDWLGGWPMEFVYDKDAVSFCRELGFSMQRMVTGEANTEFLFIRSASPK